MVANTYANRTHTYATDGFYTVTILGDCIGFAFNNGGSKLKIYNIVNWGTGFKLNATGGFRGCTNLDISATDVLDISENNQNLYFAFYATPNLVFNDSLSLWDTSNQTTMYRLFYYCNNFNIDISAWDYSGLNLSYSLQFFLSSQIYDPSYYDNLLIKWASSPSLGGLQPNIIGTIDMGTIKYTSAGASARASILANNKAVTINDGGQIW